MNKVKRVLLPIVLSILTIVIIVDTYFIVLLSQTINNMMASPENYFSFLDKPNSYVKIDDVGYLQYDGVVLDPEKIESGDIKVYSSEEITKIINEAIAKRDGIDNVTSSMD